MVSNVQMRTETADYYQRRIYAHFSSFSTRAILLSDHIFFPCSTSSVTSSHLTSKTSTTHSSHNPITKGLHQPSHLLRRLYTMPMPQPIDDLQLLILGTQLT